MKRTSDNLVANKSKDFAIRIIRLYKHLCEKKREFVLSKQILRSGTSIGANVKEAVRGQSKKDFVAKMCVALKECSETEYWLELLQATDYITEKQFQSINEQCQELLRILMSIVKTATKNIDK